MSDKRTFTPRLGGEGDRLLSALGNLEDAAAELEAAERPDIRERLAAALYHVISLPLRYLPVNLRDTVQTIKAAIPGIVWRGSDAVSVDLPEAECERLAKMILELRDEVQRRTA